MGVFGKDYSNIYDVFYSEKNYEAEALLIEEVFKISESKNNNKIKNVIDIGCGTGSHSFDLTKKGYHLTGVDASEAMLEIAKKKEGSEKIQWIRGDAKAFQIDQKFDAAIMMFAVLSYMNSNDDVLNCLKTIRSHLNLGAPFIADFWYGPGVLGVKPSDRVTELNIGTNKVLRTVHTNLNSLNHLAEVNFNIWVNSKDNGISEIKEQHKMRYFFPKEIEMYLKLAGFKIQNISEFPKLGINPTDETWNAMIFALAS